MLKWKKVGAFFIVFYQRNWLFRKTNLKCDYVTTTILRIKQNATLNDKALALLTLYHYDDGKVLLNSKDNAIGDVTVFFQSLNYS